MFKRVALGVSGGVDSAIAALLLKRRGFDVQAVFMKNWDIIDETGICKSDDDYNDARYLCNKLDIPLHQVNFVKEYWNEVFCNLIKEYENGYTPNPDIMCNRNIKFNYFYKYAMEKLNVDAIATGHYARTNFGPFLGNYDSKKSVRLLRAQDTRKDQTFFLCQISQNALKKTMFPLGDMLKWEVKHMAVENNLEKFALKPESMGICFIGSRNFQNFITEYIKDKSGNFVDIETGKVVGQHRGLHQWTIGQRSKLQSVPEALYVSRKNKKDNTIYVVPATKHPDLHTTTIITLKPHWICSEPSELLENHILHCDFKFQHTEDWVPCRVCKTSEGLVIKLDRAKRAVTPGQFAVFYKGEECLGSAVIANAGATNFSVYYLNNKKLKKAQNLLEKMNKNEPHSFTKETKYIDNNYNANIYNNINKVSQNYM
ncbi:mitochondrial tRNA-specific 2-thiouridylase 1 [Rhynchophorus ferrugineus]|uniref:tRNA-5-taurinomethyluridine 2-sulfurtransferase n=1 Tax=Rhynchophorus ferrugineus TaxID=354439 RepID=A0A834M3A6_RHYFE|nr:hypothetical protein GWI33_021378 [Rhynchophorus ferrugineus]